MLRRVLATIWFTVAGSCAVGVILTILTSDGFIYDMMLLPTWFFVFAVLAAGVAGYLVGYPLLDRTRVTKLSQAMVRGGWASLVAYGLFAVSYGIGVSIHMGIMTEIASYIYYLLVVIFFGFGVFIPIYMYWLFLSILAIGCVAGAVLYQLREPLHLAYDGVALLNATDTIQSDQKVS